VDKLWISLPTPRQTAPNKPFQTPPRNTSLADDFRGKKKLSTSYQQVINKLSTIFPTTKSACKSAIWRKKTELSTKNPSAYYYYIIYIYNYNNNRRPYFYKKYAVSKRYKIRHKNRVFLGE
jgi:hypothetical protein